MNNALQKYGHCLLPNVGLLYITTKPAYRSYPDNKVYPPSKEISLLPVSDQGNKFYSIIREIAFSGSLSPEDATQKWEETHQAIKEKLSSGSSIELRGIGLLSLDEDHQITLSPEQSPFTTYQPVSQDLIKSFLPPGKTVTSENIVTEDTGLQDPPELQPALVPAPKTGRKREMAVWWITITIIALLAVGWFVYWGTMKRNKKENIFSQIITKDDTAHPAKADSLKLKTDSVAQQIAHENDSIHYTVVFAVYDNQEKALRQFHKMRDWGHPVVLIRKDSVQYELGIPFTTLSADTTVSLVSIMKLYGNRVHIEYDTVPAK